MKSAVENLIRWKKMADYAATLAREVAEPHDRGIDSPQAAPDVGGVLGDAHRRTRTAIIQTEYDNEASLAIKEAALQRGWRIDEQWGGRCGFVSRQARIFLRFRCSDAPPEMKPAAVDYAMLDTGDGAGCGTILVDRTSVADQIRVLVEHFERYGDGAAANRHVMQPCEAYSDRSARSS